MRFWGEFKLSPLFLFLLLLLLLVASVYFGNQLQVSPLESFISYNYSGSLFSSSAVSEYGPQSITKVYNNMYFDPQNANIIQLASEE